MDEDQKKDWLNELYDTSYHRLSWITDDIFDTQATISIAVARGKKGSLENYVNSYVLELTTYIIQLKD